MTRRLVHTTLAWLGDHSLLRWGAIGLAVVALGLVLMQSEQTTAPGDAQALRGPDKPDGFVVGGTYRSFDEQGYLSTRIDSQRAEQFDDEQLIIMEYPRGVIFERESRDTWSLSARRGDYSMAEETLELVEVADPAGPGNALMVRVDAANVSEVFTAFGRRGVPAERVAEEVVEEVREWEDGDVPVGRHLADQLLVPLALAGGGTFRTLEPSSHARTNARVVGRFLDAEPRFEPLEGGAWRVAVETAVEIDPQAPASPE